MLGAMIGGALGIVVGDLLAGRSSDPETQVLAPVFGTLAGGPFGAGIGRALHRHDPVLYQRK